MISVRRGAIAVLAVLLSVAACSANKPVKSAAEFGQSPDLVAPESSVLPTVRPAKAVGWPAGVTPHSPSGHAVNAFAQGLQHPRWLHVLPNGDVLVAESDKPRGSGGFSGIKGWISNKVMKYAGSGLPSADRVTLLQDANGDGVAEARTVLVDNLNSPFGMAWVEGAFYGWPYSYWGKNVDARVSPQRPDRVAIARAPDYAVGAHTASLGLAFYEGAMFPDFQGHALIGQHGSWNRNPRSGYKVIRVRFDRGQPEGIPEDVLVGFLSPDGEAYGRPAGVVVDQQGALLVADDVGNTVWRMSRE